MTDFSLTIGDAFDRLDSPVFWLRGGCVAYCNPAARRLLPDLAPGQSAPEDLSALPAEGSASLRLGGRNWSARFWMSGEGQLFCLSDADAVSVLPDRRIPLLMQKLRGPLSVFLSSSQFIEQALTPRQTEDMASFLARQYKAQLRILRLMRNLELAALADGERPYDFTPVTLDLGGLLHEIGRQLDMPVQETGCTLTLQLPSSNLYARCDDQLLQIQLYHLVSNSIAAMRPSGGSIRLRLERSGAMAHLLVTDNGPGIDARAALYLFQPAEGNDLLSEAGRGLGIGVTVCRKIARLHGGSVLFSSQPGGGTSVCLSLPLVDPGPSPEFNSLRVSDSSNGVPLVLRELSDVLPEHLFLPEAR